MHPFISSRSGTTTTCVTSAIVQILQKRHFRRCRRGCTTLGRRDEQFAIHRRSSRHRRFIEHIFAPPSNVALISQPPELVHNPFGQAAPYRVHNPFGQAAPYRVNACLLDMLHGLSCLLLLLVRTLLDDVVHAELYGRAHQRGGEKHPVKSTGPQDSRSTLVDLKRHAGTLFSNRRSSSP
jgi:hypothetical protein